MVKTTVSAIIENDRQFLLVREGQGGPLNLPGGELHAHERLEDAGIREVHEETNLRVAFNRLVGIYQNPRTPAGNNVVRFVLSATVVGGHIETSLKHPEVDYFTWRQIKNFPPGQLAHNGIIAALKDYRRGEGAGLAIITQLPPGRKRP